LHSRKYVALMTKKKKIVVVGPCYPYRGGIATFVSYLCKLLQTEHDVHLINYSMLYPTLLFPGKTQYDESKNLVFTFPNERLFSSLNPIAWWRTAKRIAELEPDVVIMDWWNPFFGLCFRGLNFFLPNVYRKRILIVAENVVSHEGRGADKILTRLGITIGKAYIVLSDKVKNQITYFSSDKPIYKANLPIYDQFDITTTSYARADISSKLATGDFVMLCFGYIRKYKGVDIAIAAMPEILKQIPNAKLLIVGECYDAWEEYQTLINKLDLANNVHSVTEYVANEEVEQYFAVSDVVLLPYRTATQSGILNIAYGFNKPVVATNVGGFVEFIDDGKTGIIVPEVSATALAQGVWRYHQSLHSTDTTAAITAISKRNSFEHILQHVQEFARRVR
jgi:glycosyltransferase involved in cell wall biosynthesis